mmetsp:Transcript_43292/g.50708  ORF Transcript_43292/g.50708 Transcript_43292/m.50708 type:complete len:95 (+) Transcript_43292:2-286(+)
MLVVVGVNNNAGIQQDSSGVGGVDCSIVAAGGSSRAVSSYERRRIGGGVNNAFGYCSATPRGASIEFSWDRFSSSVAATLVASRAALLDTSSFA